MKRSTFNIKKGRDIKRSRNESSSLLQNSLSFDRCSFASGRFICGDSSEKLGTLPPNSVSLIFSSPPYNVGKSYEQKNNLENYLKVQKQIISLFPRVLTSEGSICWQVGNHVVNGVVTPLDMVFDPIFEKAGFILRRRFVWSVPHGLHSKHRFSGRYETVSWYSRPENQIQPAFKFSHEWETCLLDFPNVKSAHVERTEHPCQFPVELVERFVLALTQKNQTVLDPFSGAGTTVIAAVRHKRQGIGIEIQQKFVIISQRRLRELQNGTLRTRSMNTKKYVAPSSDIWSIRPKKWDSIRNPSLLEEQGFHSLKSFYNRLGHESVMDCLQFLMENDISPNLILLQSTACTVDVIVKAIQCISGNGSLCVVTNHDAHGFSAHCSELLQSGALILRNRIISWHKPLALYSSTLWFTKANKVKSKKQYGYYFDLNAVRIPAKYPGKRSARTGKLSCNPLGKNPSNIWDCDKDCPILAGVGICQIQRLVRALCPLGGHVLIQGEIPSEATTITYLKPLKRRFSFCN